MSQLLNVLGIFFISADIVVLAFADDFQSGTLVFSWTDCRHYCPLFRCQLESTFTFPSLLLPKFKSATVDNEITLPKYSFSRVTLQTLLACAIGINTQEDSSVDFLILVPYLMFYRFFFYNLRLLWLARDLILKMCFRFNNFVKLFSLHNLVYYRHFLILKIKRSCWQLAVLYIIKVMWVLYFKLSYSIYCLLSKNSSVLSNHLCRLCQMVYFRGFVQFNPSASRCHCSTNIAAWRCLTPDRVLCNTWPSYIHS